MTTVNNYYSINKTRAHTCKFTVKLRQSSCLMSSYVHLLNDAYYSPQTMRKRANAFRHTLCLVNVMSILFTTRIQDV